ncbi:hypothetical protein D9M73_134410 [compost metagenome]
MVEQRCGLLDPRADRRADVEVDLPGVDRREEIAAEHRHQRERQQHHDHEGGHEDTPPRQGEGKDRDIISAYRCETMLEPALEADEDVARFRPAGPGIVRHHDLGGVRRGMFAQ